jgi:hypothetical protein
MEIMRYLTREPVSPEDIKLARTRILRPVTPLLMKETSGEELVRQPEQLELAAGGVVSREAFKYGASKAFKEFLEKQILKNKTTYNSLDELINKSNTGINQENAVKLLKNEYPDTFKIKVENEYFPIHQNPKVTLKAIEGFKKLKEWEKNPTAENWFSVFRVTEPSGKIKQSKFAQGLRNYIQGKKGEGSVFNRYFDEIQLDENLYNEIKTYDKDLANTLKAKKGNEFARKAILEKSDEAINRINEQFKFDPNSSIEELTEALYGNQFKNADKKTQLILATQTSDDVLKYLKVLEGARPEQAKKIKLPDQETINEIVDNIAAGKKGGFRFQEGTLRQYKFDIRDTLLGLQPGTSSQLRQKVLFGKKRVIDESVGLSATYERAPGYTEASQFLSPETNRIKGQVIDRPFKRALDKALDGDLSEVKEYNKIAKQFKKEYPDVDVPIIEIGKNPKGVVKHFDSFSKEAQKDILNIYNKSNISIRTNSKPLSVLIDEYQKAEKLEGKAKITALTALGLTSAGIANAEEVSNLTPMEASILPSLSEIKNVIQENPIASGVTAATSPLALPKIRKKALELGKKGLNVLGDIGVPLVVGLEGYRMGQDFEKGVPFSESLSGVMLMDEPIRRQKILNRMGDDARLLVKQTKGMMPEDGLDKLSMEEIDKFYTGLNLKPDLNLIQKYKDASVAQEAERAIVAQQREAQLQKIRENFPEQKEIPDVYATGGIVEPKDESYNPEIPSLGETDPIGILEQRLMNSNDINEIMRLLEVIKLAKEEKAAKEKEREEYKATQKAKGIRYKEDFPSEAAYFAETGKQLLTNPKYFLSKGAKGIVEGTEFLIGQPLQTLFSQTGKNFEFYEPVLGEKLGINKYIEKNIPKGATTGTLLAGDVAEIAGSFADPFLAYGIVKGVTRPSKTKGILSMEEIDPTRRDILKTGAIIGAGAALYPTAKKLGIFEELTKGTKVTARILPKVPGMPEWFPSLISKIEKEGVDVIRKLEGKDNLVYVKKIEIPVTGKKDPETIFMTRYPDGTIEINTNIKGGAYDEPFELYYKPPKTRVDEKTGKVIEEPGNFSVIEQRPKPDPNDLGNYEFDYEMVSKNEALSDIEKLESFSTGKVKNLKEAEKRATQRKNYFDSPYDDISNRYPEPDYD